MVICIEMQEEDEKMESRPPGFLFFVFFSCVCEGFNFIFQHLFLCMLTPGFVVLKRAEIFVKSCTSAK